MEAKNQTSHIIFAGLFRHALDPKRRLTVPSRWREMAGDPKYLFVLPDPEKACLNLMTLEQMNSIFAHPADELDSFLDDGISDSYQDIFSSAEQLPLDVQGRIRIGDDLLAFAGLTDQVVLSGARNRIQVWAAEHPQAPKGVDQNRIAASMEALRALRQRNRQA